MAQQQFVVRSKMPAPVEDLFAWHGRPGAFERLNPPWAPVEILERTGGITNGARTVVRVWVGPFRKRWVAIHQGYEENRQFQDRQERGPFAHFLHTHRTIPDGPDASFLEDHIEYDLPLGVLGQLLGGRMARAKLARTFAYRHSVTANDLALHAARRGQPPWRILITGATGLVGSALAPFLTAGGHQVLRLGRGQPTPDALSWDQLDAPATLQTMEGLDAVVHLAGENIGSGRWTQARKEKLRASRLDTTQRLVAALGRLARPPKTLLCASAVGYYGHRGDEVLDESSAAGTGFLADLCQEWEAACAPAGERGIRVVNARFGVILSPRGGALAKMLTPFRLGLGGRIGPGTQWLSWIALDDVLGAIHHCLAQPTLAGPVNFVAPEALTNRAFTKVLGKVLFQPTIIPLPAFVAKLAFGEMAKETLLASTRAAPKKLEESGYRFLFPELRGALEHMLGKNEIRE